MKRKIIMIIASIILVFLLAYAVPIPSKVFFASPAYNYTDKVENVSSQVQLSINAWKLNYLFQNDRISGTLSLTTQDKSIIDNATFNSSLYRVGPLESLGDVEYYNVSYYDQGANVYQSCGIYSSHDNQMQLIKNDGVIFVSPANNYKEAKETIDYFDDYIDDITITELLYNPAMVD